MHPVLTIFVAGSKELNNERTVCRSVCNTLQNQWGTIVTKTFEDFSEVISSTGHQNEYNKFICNEADIVIFIFSGKVGTITLSEFHTAYNSFIKHGHPHILVYIDKRESSNSKEIDQLKQELSANDQYYKEYLDTKELELMVDKHLTKFLISHTHSATNNNKVTNNRSSKRLGTSLYLVLIWALLALIGGIGMYFYDQSMSEEDCLGIAVQHIESGRNGELYYYFPDATYVYDSTTKELVELPRKNSSSSTDISLPKIEHASLGVTITMLISRALKFKPGGNAKAIIGYVAVVAASLVGFGVGCVLEQMIFPPQYSTPVRQFLSEPSNWEKIDKDNRRKPSHWL